MYKISFVLFFNVNSTRYKFYEKIQQHLYEKKRESISEKDLITMGLEAGLTKNQVEDEIIGCIYAPFLVKYGYLETEYYPIYNGEIKFADLLESGKYQESELGLKLSFEEKVDRLILHLTDHLSNEFVGQLLDRKWSRNKSKKRLMRKCKKFDKLLYEIDHLLDQIKTYTPNRLTYIDLLEKYGSYWKQMRGYTGNFFFRGYYKSELIDQHETFFTDLLEYCVQPVDWSGNSIKVEKFTDLERKHSITDISFLEHCITDGLVRFCGRKDLTLTSTGYSLMQSYFTYKNDASRLEIFFRRLGEDCYVLMVGENSLFSTKVKSYLEENFEYNPNGWFNREGSKKEVLQYLKLLSLYVKGGEYEWKEYKKLRQV